jgi:hypothetical protein
VRLPPVTSTLLLIALSAPIYSLQLDSWFNSLPDGLLIRQRSALTLPSVLSLHMCYWWLILHLHLPLFERIQSIESDPVVELSGKMCDRATDKLVQLFGRYDKQYGFRYFPSNMLQVRLMPYLFGSS